MGSMKVRHLVFWKFKEQADGFDKEANIKRAEEALRGLKGLVPQVRELEVGRDFKKLPVSFELALNTTFDSRDDLEAYQVHPEHVKVKDLLAEIVSDRAVVDYELP